ncbi:hypothetical protein, partial [Flagellimonas marinaquae]
DTTQTIFVAVIPESPILIKQIICFVAPTKRVDSDCQAFCSNSFGLLPFHHMQQFISNWSCRMNIISSYANASASAQDGTTRWKS